jgi:hypothetical protein
VTLPGFFRPTQQWDLVVVFEGNLLTSIECKALCGPSFGNNFNNRVEEALGISTDIWTAYREGVLGNSLKPFLGYVLLLEDAAGSTKPVNVLEKHFRVSEEFCGASYIDRCEESLRRFMKERCYDAVALICSQKKSGSRGVFNEPSKDISFRRFAMLITGQVVASYNAIKDEID